MTKKPFTPIAQMGPYDFWCSPFGIGLSSEDAQAMKSGTATEEQARRALIAGRLAFDAIILMPVNEQRPA